MADPTKLMKLLEIAEKFGIKRSKIIGTQGNVVPLKKPSLTSVTVDEFKLKNSVDEGDMTMDKVKQELEETVKLALSNNLNDVELSKAVNNAIRIDRQFFPPSAEVIAAGSGEQVTGKGLEEIIQKGGLMAPPNTPLGKADFQIKRAKQGVEDIKKEFDIGNLIKGAGKDQLSEIRLHNEGLVRAVTRQILSEDIRAGKIKSLDLEKLGTSREPIDYFRKIYGEDALEKLDSIAPEFNRFYTEKEATDFARSKFKFEPDETRIAGSTSYEELEKAKENKDERSFLERLFGINKNKGKKEAEVLNITAEGDKRKTVDELIDEYNANYDRTLLTDEEGGSAISYQEFQDLHKRNEEIAKELERKGIKSTPDVEEAKPTGEVIPFRKKFTEPEEKSSGGRIGYAKGKRVMSSIDKLLENLNTKLSKKKSMETVNPKTGEVTIPKQPIKRAEEPTGVTVMDQEPVKINERKTIDYDAMEEANKLNLKHKEAAYAFDEIQPIDIYDKIAPDRVAEVMAEIKGKDYADLSQKQQLELYRKAQSFLDDYKKIDRINIAVKKFNTGQELQAIDKKYLSQFLPESGVTFESKVDKSIWKKGDPITEENFGSTPFAPSQETLDNLEKARKMSSEMSLEKRMNEVLNQYDKSMFKKNEQGMVDVTDSENIQRMALLLKRDHPDIYNEIFNLTEDLNQKQILDEFDVTGRKPNSEGGIAGLL